MPTILLEPTEESTRPVIIGSRMKPEVVGSAPVATWTYRARNWTAPAKTMPQMMVPSSER
ncbi:hypothetical protein OHB07_01225 [Streptomyces sp. NBC_00111]|uniref:hypothetical protein n=1 Tax=Streptomyces sp. NBC_00111 TaxID=2975655 RepID=UPI00324D55B0